MALIIQFQPIPSQHPDVSFLAGALLATTGNAKEKYYVTLLWDFSPGAHI